MNPLNHVAIIMDGNGRWGLKHKNARNAGHKAGLTTVEKIIKVAWKEKDPFPNNAKDIIEYLKNNPVGENNKYSYSKPKFYTFNFKRSPDQTVSELFGQGVDAKWANILYIGQIPEKEIQEIEKLPAIQKKIKTAISKEDRMYFKNEIFSIRKIR